MWNGLQSSSATGALPNGPAYFVSYVNWLAGTLALVPAVVVTVTATAPVTAAAGDNAVTEVGEVTVNSFAATFPNEILVTDGFSKFRPVILTFVPPAIPRQAVGAAHSRQGRIINAISEVLGEEGAPMQPGEVHEYIEALLGERVRRASVKATLAGNVHGPSPRFVRVARGRYRLAGRP